MSEGIYNTPHQERREARSWGGNTSKMLPCAHKRCTARVHKLCQIDWLQQHGLEVVHNDSIFLPTAQQVLPELCLIAPCIFPLGVVPHILF